MNLSELSTRVKMDCGLYSIALPFKLEDFIKDVLMVSTLKTFSTYCPNFERYTFNMNDFELAEPTRRGVEKSYLLPEIFSAREITQVKMAPYEDHQFSEMGFFAPLGMVSSYYRSVPELAIANARLQLSRATRTAPTIKFTPPRTITFYATISNLPITLDIGFVHNIELNSITSTMEESFYKLALLDIQSKLYQTMKHYNELNTAYGNINLKIDEWANADDQKKTLIEKWDNTYHMDIMPFIYG